MCAPAVASPRSEAIEWTQWRARGYDRGRRGRRRLGRAEPAGTPRGLGRMTVLSVQSRRPRARGSPSARALAGAACAGVLFTSAPTHAGDFVAGELGLDWVSEYVFRGVVEEDEGIIVQPWLELAFHPGERAYAFAGTWGSVHSRETWAGAHSGAENPNLRAWYEQDLWAGAGFAIADAYLEAYYYAYTSPSGAFAASHELIFAVAYDDAGLLHDDVALSPAVDLSIPLADGGAFLGPSVEPSVDLEPTLGAPLAVAFPTAFGVALGDYYGGDITYVHLSSGAEIAYSLATADYGAWTFRGGLRAVLANADLNPELRSRRVAASAGVDLAF